MGGRTSLKNSPQHSLSSPSPDSYKKSVSTSPGSERVTQGLWLRVDFLPSAGAQAGQESGRGMPSRGDEDTSLPGCPRFSRGCCFPLRWYPSSALQEMLYFRHLQQSGSHMGFFAHLRACRVPGMAGRQNLASAPSPPAGQGQSWTSTSCPRAAAQFAEPSLGLQFPRSGLCLPGPCSKPNSLQRSTNRPPQSCPPPPAHAQQLPSHSLEGFLQGL